MKQEKENFASMRILVPKEVYNKFKVHAILNNTSVSEMVRNYLSSVVSNEAVLSR